MPERTQRFPLARRLDFRLALRIAVRRLARQETGMAAVEFSLILPILVVLWIGGVEVTQALSVDRRLNNLASSIGDLVARSKKVTYADVDNIFDIAPGAMFPYDATGLAMRITAVEMDEDGDASVGWACTSGTVPAQLALNTVIPETLRIADTQLIMSEVYDTYTPAVGYVVTGPLDLEDRMFFVPRTTAHVQLCDNSDPPVCPKVSCP
jgi:Flp pilus assembly protein TadG